MLDTKQKRLDAYTIVGDPFIALINHEEPYSIWPAKKEVPVGWKTVGFSGSKQDVSAFIDEHWTHMRPASLKREMEKQLKH